MDKKIVLTQDDIKVVQNVAAKAKDNGNADNCRLDNIVLESFDIEKAQKVQHGYQFDLDPAALDNLKRLAGEANLEGQDRDSYQALLTKIQDAQYTSQVHSDNPGISTK